MPRPFEAFRWNGALGTTHPTSNPDARASRPYQKLDRSSAD
jgi:hypothetical protein